MNYALKIQYNGSNYCGWQRQQNGVSVQQVIEEKLSVILRENISIIGAGRTDSGVHATGQIANFFAPEIDDLRRFQHSLNSVLPKDILITKIKQVPDDFHARYSAISRCYRYYISTTRSPFRDGFCYFYYHKLSLELLNSYSLLLCGYRDCSIFTKNLKDNSNSYCDIKSASWKVIGNLFIFSIEANRFLHGMVRAIVGTQLSSCRKGMSPDEFFNLLQNHGRHFGGPSVPAQGLFLTKVRYK